MALSDNRVLSTLQNPMLCNSFPDQPLHPKLRRCAQHLSCILGIPHLPRENPLTEARPEKSTLQPQSTKPIGSMYAIYGNIHHQYTPNVSIYTIHGSYGKQCG